MSFKTDVYAVVRQIPRGEVLTYKQVAEAMGRPGASRAVGTALKENNDKTVPCHRVIRSDGKLGGYNGFQGKKERLLKEEGYLK
jgi:O-6-methylguanine DNA methyltransferase